MEKQRSLFVTEYARSFSQAVATLEPLVIPLLWKSHTDAIEDIGERITRDRAFFNLLPGERAQFLHRQIVTGLQDLLVKHATQLQYRWYNYSGMDLLLVEGEVLLGFKKLDKSLRRSNYATGHNESFWSQSAGELPIKLIAGYTPNAAWNQSKLFITLPSRRRRRSGAIEWLEVGDQAEVLIRLQQSGVASVAPAAEKPKFSVKPRTSSKQPKRDGRSDVG